MRSGLAASGKALKQVAEQHVFFIDPIGHRQLAHSRSRPVGPKSLDDPGPMRGRECETNKGVEIEAQLAGHQSVKTVPLESGVFTFPELNHSKVPAPKEISQHSRKVWLRWPFLPLIRSSLGHDP
jgi:hypothetical protein